VLSRRLSALGPGLIVAVTAIGASHIVLAPVAGARYGYALVWLVLIAHIFKYPAFDFAARFAVGTGSSLIRGYERVPGPRHWALILFLVTTTLQGLTILSGVMSVSAAILRASVGILPYPAWLLLVGGAAILLLMSGRYSALQAGAKVMLGILVLGTLVAFVTAPPSPTALARALIPSVPGGSLLLVSAILGLMPTGINVSVWHSLWAVEHLPRWREDGSDDRAVLRKAVFDLRLGYWVSAALAVVFISLGATLLQPRGLVPNGIDVALTLSRIYTERLGAWMFPVFMTTAFFAMFSSVYTVMDGFPRAFASVLRTIFPASTSAGNNWLHLASNPAYWGFMGVIFTFSVLVNTLIPNPVLMVQLVGTLSLMIAPLLFALNYYCATRLAPQAVRPGGVMRGWALAGITFMAAAASLSIYMQLR
jgi:Mn2+/Fe2+ NRAMP family transporter